MRRLKTIFVAFLTFAVATLPAAGAFGPLAMANASDEAVNVHCAEHHQSAHAEDEQQGKHESGKDAGRAMGHCTDDGCCGQCLCIGMTAVLERNSKMRASRLPLPSDARAKLDLIGLTYVPQPPPPRV